MLGEVFSLLIKIFELRNEQGNTFQYLLANGIPASMQWMEPPASSIVGTDSGTIFTDSSLSAFCSAVREL